MLKSIQTAKSYSSGMKLPKGRNHSVSQNYYPQKTIQTRKRYHSITSMHSERPIFNKLSQIIWNEDTQNYKTGQLHKVKQQRHFSIANRNSLKLGKKYNNCNESTTVASLSTKKLSQALKKHKWEALGYYIDWASELMKESNINSLRKAVTNSFRQTLSNYSTPQHIKGRNSNPVIMKKNFQSENHNKNKKESTLISSKQSSMQDICRKKKIVSFIDSSKYITTNFKESQLSSLTKTVGKRAEKNENGDNIPKQTIIQPTDVNELIEFIEVEDYWRRVSQNKPHTQLNSPLRFKNPSKKWKKKKVKSNSQHTHKGKRNIKGTHLTKNMSITITKDNKIIYW